MDQQSSPDPCIAEELALYERVKAAVRDVALKRQPDMADVSRRLVELRDEAATAAAHDLPALFDQLNVHQSLARRNFIETLPDMRSPYFGHLRLAEDDGRIRDILIGHQTFLSTEHNISIVDWKNAPIAKLFFSYREGDHFHEKLPGREITGIIQARRILTFVMGKLQAVSSSDEGYRLHGEQWLKEGPVQGRSLRGGAGTADRGQRLGVGVTGRAVPDVSALLDAQQYGLLSRSPDEHLLILGGAGSGKTTVALYRLASLCGRDPRRFRPERMLVIVPDEGLARLSRRILKNLSLEGVKVSSYDHWVMSQGRHILKCLPPKICEDTPARVLRFKRHPSVLELFADISAKRVDEFCAQLEEGLHFIEDVGMRFRMLEAPCLMQRIERFEAHLRLEASQTPQQRQREFRLDKIEEIFTSLKKQIFNLDWDRRHLWSDRDLLLKAVRLSDGAVSESMVDEVIKHSRAQMSDVDPLLTHLPSGGDAIVTLDGIDVKEDEDSIKGSVDLEDYSVLLALLRYHVGEIKTLSGRLQQFKHLVVDEAQELAPVELQVLSEALDEDASITIAGDAAQQTDPTTSFENWQMLLDQMGAGDIAAHNLQVNYRSPQPIADFAHYVLGPFAPAKAPEAQKDGVAILRDHFADHGLLAMALRESLEDLLSRETKASIALVCRDDESKDEMYQLIKDIPKARLVRKGNFSFEAGIDVTEVAEVKGLEFDYVIIPDATINNYPDLAESRRALHVAATRAMHQLWVISSGVASPLLPPEVR